MKVTSLTLNQMRGIEQAEFQFQPGMNLIVGVNGAGKSSVLDALRVTLSRMLPRLTSVKMRQESFSASDITNGRGSLTVQMQIALGGQTLEQLIHLPRERYAETEQSGEVRDQTYGLEPRDELTLHPPDGAPLRVEAKKDLAAHVKIKKATPLAIYFAARRSLYSEAAGSQSARSGGGPTFAFADALRPRELRIREFTSWWRVQEEIGSPERLEALREAVLTFLDDFSDVRVTDESEPTMVLRKGQRTLGVSQLSDGERGMLSLVLDVARRLSLANPTLADPLREGQAVILIDEIDLHLHPRWQRSVVGRLAATFPQCQFIATTHSPFVIQSLKPGQLINLDPESDEEGYAEDYADKSIEDISEDVMGIELPQKSQRYLDMMKTAEEYYRIVHKAKGAPSEEREALKHRLDELSIPYSDDAAFTAFLKFQRESALREDETDQ
ncbi:AAA family ATPase [Chloroflexia bacterium SDU3-3]|nr:AAA family ATPase [Chloroflexia bacterium SDU3-3]